MGLTVLIVVGGIIGWLASILTRTDDRQGIVSNIAVGMVSAILSAIMVDGSAFVGAVSPVGLFASFAGSTVLLSLFGLYRRKMVR